jgi:tetratricopeptide (TPR) repeat protein
LYRQVPDPEDKKTFWRSNYLEAPYDPFGREQMNRLEPAADDLKDSIQFWSILASNDSNALLHLARASEREEDYGEVIKCLQEAVRRSRPGRMVGKWSPLRDPSRANLRRIYMMNPDFEGEVSFWKTLLIDNQDDFGLI